eukprot:snap_masked-scaffold_50-processed-gene-0.31-mRNA-1 protein AED:1.00 eAED:1.00 QI:0/-1/0/0/-1/1/1/0/167
MSRKKLTKEDTINEIRRELDDKNFYLCRKKVNHFKIMLGGCFRTSNKSSHKFTKSETKENFGIEVVKLRRCKIVCTSSKSCTFEVNFKFDLKKNAYIFQVINLEHVGHDIRKISTVKKYLTNLTETGLECLHTLGRAKASMAAAELCFHITLPGIMYDINFEYQTTN